MNQDGPHSSSFEEVRETLDPECSHIIFECADGSGGGSDFQAITEGLSQFEESILDQYFFYDEGRDCIFLALKLDPARLDRIVEEFLKAGLPKDITFYIYANRLVK